VSDRLSTKGDGKRGEPLTFIHEIQAFLVLDDKHTIRFLRTLSFHRLQDQ
jgi:hypothetical protein